MEISFQESEDGRKLEVWFPETPAEFAASPLELAAILMHGEEAVQIVQREVGYILVTRGFAGTRIEKHPVDADWKVVEPAPRWPW